jgi:hypothetical protein
MVVAHTNGYEVIYKGETIVDVPNNYSMVSYTKELGTVELTHKSNKTIIKNGVIQ